MRLIQLTFTMMKGIFADVEQEQRGEQKVTLRISYHRWMDPPEHRRQAGIRHSSIHPFSVY